MCTINACVEEAKKKKKKQKDSEKPDTFAEKLAVHMTKNLQVSLGPSPNLPPSAVNTGLELFKLFLGATSLYSILGTPIRSIPCDYHVIVTRNDSLG